MGTETAVSPRGEGEKKRKKEKKHKGGKENADGVAGVEGSQHSPRQLPKESELAPLQLSRSGRIKASLSPGKGSQQKASGFTIPKPPPGAQNKLLDNLPKVERRGFDVEAKLFQQVQKEYEEARSKKRFIDIGERSKHKALGALDTPHLAKHTMRQEAATAPLEKISRSDVAAGLGLTTGAMDDTKVEMKTMNKKSVLPSIPTTQAGNACNSQQESETPVRTVEEVQAMLPEEYKELKQMMELHRDLKSQMTRNKEQILRLQESGETGEMMDLLRQQSSHVVMMMKDVLDRMESYPEELWALYGAVEAFEQCSENRDRLLKGEQDEGTTDTTEEPTLGPNTVQEHEEALADIYSHILEAVHNYLSTSDLYEAEEESAPTSS